MRTDAGFTVAELLAAIVVIALGMGLIGEAISSQVNTWHRVQEERIRIQDLLRLYPHLRAVEAERISSPNPLEPAAVKMDNGVYLEFSTPRVTHSAECVFDSVGLRCQ